MLEVRGFRGVRFVPGPAGDLDSAVTPPYDVISPEERVELYSRNNHSMARLILPEERDGADMYEAASRDLRAWLKQGVLRQDESDSIYILEQRFRDQYGRERVRRGFLAVTKLPETGDGTVLGHERTFSHVVDDRYKLMDATQANLGPVFVLYDDGGAPPEILTREPKSAPDLVAHTIDDVEQRVWRVDSDPALTDFFRDKRLYIADGHHRFHTACLYRDHVRETTGGNAAGEHDYVLMGFVSLSDPGLAIYPTHRLMPALEGFDKDRFLNALERWFEVEPLEGDVATQVEREKTCAIGLIIHGGGRRLLRLREIDRKSLLGDDRSEAWRDLDVAVLHRGIVERIMGLGDYRGFSYERDAEKVVAAVESGRYGLGFVHRSPTAEQIRACAEAGETMPHKSTYFYPKLPTGAVIHLL